MNIASAFAELSKDDIKALLDGGTLTFSAGERKLLTLSDFVFAQPLETEWKRRPRRAAPSMSLWTLGESTCDVHSHLLFEIWARGIKIRAIGGPGVAPSCPLVDFAAILALVAEKLRASCLACRESVNSAGVKGAADV